MNLNVKLIILKSVFIEAVKSVCMLSIQRTEDFGSRLVSMCLPHPDMVRVVTSLWRLSGAKYRVYYSFSYNS